MSTRPLGVLNTLIGATPRGVMRKTSLKGGVFGFNGVRLIFPEWQYRVFFLNLEPNFGALRFKTESEQLIWSESSRLITNCIIYYNAALLSRLLEIKETAGEEEQVSLLGRVSPIAWQHINFHGRFEFLDPPAPIDLESVVQDLVRGEFSISEVLN